MIKIEKYLNSLVYQEGMFLTKGQLQELDRKKSELKARLQSSDPGRITTRTANVRNSFIRHAVATSSIHVEHPALRYGNRKKDRKETRVLVDRLYSAYMWARDRQKREGTDTYSPLLSGESMREINGGSFWASPSRVPIGRTRPSFSVRRISRPTLRVWMP